MSVIDGQVPVRDQLDEKVTRVFAGKVVRKDLVGKVKVGANVPVFVLEYLLGKYCASSDEMAIRMGLQTRPVGRPSKKPIVTFASFRYQAKGWTRARRVMAKVEWHQGESYPRVGFIVTSL